MYREIVGLLSGKEADQTGGVCGALINDRIVEFVDGDKFSIKIIQFFPGGFQIGVHEFGCDVDFRDTRLNGLADILQRGSGTAVKNQRGFRQTVGDLPAAFDIEFRRGFVVSVCRAD